MDAVEFDYTEVFIDDAGKQAADREDGELLKKWKETNANLMAFLKELSK